MKHRLSAPDLQCFLTPGGTRKHFTHHTGDMSETQCRITETGSTIKEGSMRKIAFIILCLLVFTGCNEKQIQPKEALRDLAIKQFAVDNPHIAYTIEESKMTDDAQVYHILADDYKGILYIKKNFADISLYLKDNNRLVYAYHTEI